jgi:hypothetical protein
MAAAVQIPKFYKDEIQQINDIAIPKATDI